MSKTAAIFAAQTRTSKEGITWSAYFDHNDLGIPGWYICRAGDVPKYVPVSKIIRL